MTDFDNSTPTSVRVFLTSLDVGKGFIKKGKNLADYHVLSVLLVKMRDYVCFKKMLKFKSGSSSRFKSSSLIQNLQLVP